MALKLSKYITELRSNANRMEQTDLRGQSDGEDNKNKIHTRRIVVIIISIAITFFMGKGFSSIFISYVSAVLSILVGLFINSLIFGMDKFYQKPVKKYLNSQEKSWDIKSYNYNRQFLYITGYNIVRCIFTLVILSLSAIFPLFNECTDLRDFTFNIHFLNAEYFTNGLIFFIVFLQKFLVIYWIGCVVHNTLFIVSSMVTFMALKGKMSDNPITEEVKPIYSITVDKLNVDSNTEGSIIVHFKTEQSK